MAKFITTDVLSYFYSSFLTKLKGLFVAQVAGQGLSTNDYTTAEKTKLAGVAAGANNYVLPNADTTTIGGVKIGSNISVDTTNHVISLSKANVTTALGYTPPTVNTTYADATESADGLMSATDKTKLDTVSASAEPNVINSIVFDGTTLTIANKTASIDMSNFARKSDISKAVTYKGSVDSYSKLPTTGIAVGDMYNITAADATHDIQAGDNVIYNGTSWDNTAGYIDTSVLATKTDLSSAMANIVEASDSDIDTILA